MVHIRILPPSESSVILRINFCSVSSHKLIIICQLQYCAVLERFADMKVAHDITQKIEKIDTEIIQLLAERVSLYQEASEEDPDALSIEQAADSQAQWDEAADEHGWNPAILMKICRGVLELCRQAD
jgi:chorismate mutase